MEGDGYEVRTGGVERERREAPCEASEEVAEGESDVGGVRVLEPKDALGEALVVSAEGDDGERVDEGEQERLFEAATAGPEGSTAAGGAGAELFDGETRVREQRRRHVAGFGRPFPSVREKNEKARERSRGVSGVHEIPRSWFIDASSAGVNANWSKSELFTQR